MDMYTVPFGDFAEHTYPFEVRNLDTGERERFSSLTLAYCHADRIKHQGYEIWEGPIIHAFELGAAFDEDGRHTDELPRHRPLGERGPKPLDDDADERKVA